MLTFNWGICTLNVGEAGGTFPSISLDYDLFCHDHDHRVRISSNSALRDTIIQSCKAKKLNQRGAKRIPDTKNNSFKLTSQDNP